MPRRSSEETDAELTALETYLDELDRKTYSTFTVTDPVSAVKSLQVDPAGVRIRDANGNVVYGNATPLGVTGFRSPMPMYPSIPLAAEGSTNTTFKDTWQTSTIVTTKAISIYYRFADLAPTGGTTETRVQYDAGAGRVTMTGSGTTGVNPTNSTFQFAFTWPSNLYNTEVTIYLQCRMASGTGGCVVSPIYVLGA